MLFGCDFTNMEPPKLDCNIDVEILRDSIKTITNADTVLVYTKRLREEIYFPEMICIAVVIENPSTKTLNLKILPIDKYKRFEDFSQIENKLINEAEPIARMILENCEHSEFNDLIIEFIKRDSSGFPMYRFICHYDDLFISYKGTSQNK